MSSPNLTAANAAFYCTYQFWNPIQAEANGLVIGNCANAGWILGANLLSYAPRWTGDPTPYYWGGYINGNYNACGWINNYRVTSTGGGNPTPSLCQNPDYKKVSYVYCSASPCGGSDGDQNTNLDIWSSPDGNDGVLVNNPLDCPEYANFHPFDPNSSGEGNPDGDAPAHSNRLYLRYVARYLAHDGSGYYAMVHDGANWRFVPWHCFTG